MEEELQQCCKIRDSTWLHHQVVAQVLVGNETRVNAAVTARRGAERANQPRAVENGRDRQRENAINPKEPSGRTSETFASLASAGNVP